MKKSLVRTIVKGNGKDDITVKLQHNTYQGDKGTGIIHNVIK